MTLSELKKSKAQSWGRESTLEPGIGLIFFKSFMDCLQKICTKCGTKKDVSDFYKKKSTIDGYLRECKRCTLDRQKVWYTANKKKVTKKQAQYQKLYRKKNKQKYIDLYKKYYQENKKKIYKRIQSLPHRKKYASNWQKKIAEVLDNNYVKKCLRQLNIKSTPINIEIKREQLKLKRKIYEKQRNTTNID